MNLRPATYVKIEDAKLQLRGLYNVEDFSWNILFCHRVPSEISRVYVYFFFITIHCSLLVRQNCLKSETKREPDLAMGHPLVHKSPCYCFRISNLENFTLEIWFTGKGDPEIRADVLPGMLDLLWTEKASPPASSRMPGSIRTATGQCCREMEGSSFPSYQ